MPNQTPAYIRRVDAVRTALMAALIFSVYPLPLPLMRYFSLLCGFAPCALFALYGYFVLRPHRNGRHFIEVRYLMNTLRVFFMLLIAYAPLGCLYQWLYYDSAFSWLSFSNILTFFEFSKWPIDLGESIWLIHSALYALAVFALFWRYSGSRTADGIICGVLLILGIVFGELSGILHMPFHVERNFLTMTVPYMLLGKLLRCASEKIKALNFKKLIFLFCGGVVLCVAEAFVLRQTKTLDNCEHLIGFIPMTAAVVIFAVRGPVKEEVDAQDIRLSAVYRFMYYLYNPIAEFYFLLTAFLVGSPKLYNFAAGITAIVALALTYLLSKWRAEKLFPEMRRSSRPVMTGDSVAASLNVVRSERPAENPDRIDRPRPEQETPEFLQFDSEDSASHE